MRLWVFIIGLMLAGCGGGGGGDDGGGGGDTPDDGPVIDPRFARIDAYEAQTLRVLGDPLLGIAGLTPTPEASLPVTGSAVFNGSATAGVEDPAATLVLYGDAAVTVQFGAGTVLGTMDNFFGTNAAGDVVDYGGSISVDDGTVGAALTLDYAGVLTDELCPKVGDGVIRRLG